VWVAATGVVLGSIYTVGQRVTRPTAAFDFNAPSGHALEPGDGVFLETDAGLWRIGEVTQVPKGKEAVRIEVLPQYADDLPPSPMAICRRTPMSAEEAINALLPPKVQRRAAERMARAWEQKEDELAAAWKPIAAELAVAYFDLIGDDLQLSISVRETELWRIARKHAGAAAADWPVMEERLRPILQQHLTPVLGRLLNDAISDLPKMRIAWSVTRGRYDEAYELMLEWLAVYLANMSEADREELHVALGDTWEAASRDPVLTEAFNRIGRRIRDDQELAHVLTEIYREAIAENPQTAQFLRSKVLESPEIRQQMYRFVELFAPTLRSVTALTLFDETGTTRPEVVHLVRSIALRRKVAWVTLVDSRADAEGPAGAPLTRSER
jgi:hypothetical protein